ncbi:protein arginine N-methyltransferase 1.5 isoform X2, partial [Tanacetum coccineum]
MNACLLPTPKGKSSGNYARCVNQILQNLNNMQVVEVTDSWELWISFRLLCEHHSHISVALDVHPRSTHPFNKSIGRWYGELSKQPFFILKYTELPNLCTSFWKTVHNIPAKSSPSAANQTDIVAQRRFLYLQPELPRHDLKSYLNYVGYLYERMDPLSEQEQFEIGYRDFLQSPLQ